MSKGSKTKIPDFYECDITAHDLYKYYNTQFLGNHEYLCIQGRTLYDSIWWWKNRVIHCMSDSLQKNVKLGYLKK